MVMAMKVTALLVVLCATLTAQSSSVEGTVINRTNGEPIGGAHVGLVTGDMQNATDAYGAISDKAGHFSVSSMKPGGIQHAR